MTCRDIAINESTMYEALTETCVLLAQEATELDYCSSNNEYKDCGVKEILLSAFGKLQRGNNKLRSVISQQKSRCENKTISMTALKEALVHCCCYV